jgi:hypothetical protein
VRVRALGPLAEAAEENEPVVGAMVAFPFVGGFVEAVGDDRAQLLGFWRVSRAGRNHAATSCRIVKRVAAC